MNAPAKMAICPIRLHLPWISDDEHALRMRLFKARDLSALKAVAAEGHDRSRYLYWMVNELANEWLLSPAGKDDLRDLADTLVRLFMVAGALQRLEAPCEE